MAVTLTKRDAKYTEQLHSGVVLYQYDPLSLQQNKCVLSLNDKNNQICRKKVRIIGHASKRKFKMKDVLGFLFGPISKTFIQVVSRKERKGIRVVPWRYFSIVFKTETWDFCVSKYDEKLVTCIILGFQRYMESPYLQWTYSNILAKKGWMKISHFASKQGFTRLQLLSYHANRLAHYDRAEIQRSKRSVFNKGNKMNSGYYDINRFQCVVYQKTLNDFLTSCYRLLLNNQTEDGWKELIEQCSNFSAKLKNESNIDIKAIALFEKKVLRFNEAVTEKEMSLITSNTSDISEMEVMEREEIEDKEEEEEKYDGIMPVDMMEF